MNLYPYTEFDLVEGFAKQCGNDFAYVPSRGQWFFRSVSDDGQPFWEPDERAQILYWIRLVLQEFNENLALSTGTLKPNPNLCTAAAVRAVEELARSDPHFVITEADLKPGALAKSDAEIAEFMKWFQRDSGAEKATEARSPAALPAAAGPDALPAASSDALPAAMVFRVPLTTPTPKAKPYKPKPPKPKTNPANPVPTPGIAATPRSLVADMARWAAIGSTA